MDFYGELEQEQLLYQLSTKPMRIILITLKLLTTLASKAGLSIVNLRLLDGCHPENDYLAVTSYEPFFANLLKASLLEAGEDTSV